MKIFSNFNTKLRENTFRDYQGKYGVDNVLCFGRSTLYLWIKFIFPFFLYTGLAIFTLIFFYKPLGGEYFSYIITAVVIIYLVIMLPNIGKFIDYKMDFIIVVPNAIMMYEQGGVFNRNIITISAQSIKSISLQKKGLLYSIFDNGDLIILTEGDNAHNGEIIFRRVPRPEKRKNQIIKVVGIDVQADQNPHH